jgi:hypothetical protein
VVESEEIIQPYVDIDPLAETLLTQREIQNLNLALKNKELEIYNLELEKVKENTLNVPSPKVIALYDSSISELQKDVRNIEQRLKELTK